MGNADLYGGYLLPWLPAVLPAELYGFGAGKNQSVPGLPAEDHPADPLDFHSAQFLCGQGFCGFPGRAYQRHYRGMRYYDCILQSIQ